MAMLAEPRRKQKVINLRAKNNAWSNDNTKFGQRMLEKMGWKSGKGLGANENGITEHVVARYKNDDKGLGFEDKNDQWTKHEDDFNALLANLSNASDNSENLHSGVSLEVKSKKSKARIHYHKFTRGKDISRYSEKDLANIFGKKSFKDTEVAAEPVEEVVKTTEQVFTEKGSMADYFKSKFAAFKSKSKDISNVTDNDDEEPSYAFQGFAQDTDTLEVHDSDVTNGFGYNTQSNIECNENSSSNLESDSVKVKKKKKKSKNSEHIETSAYINVNDSSNDVGDELKNSDENQECIKKSKKMKKSKDKVSANVPEVTNACEDLEYITPDSIEIKKKKKSKKKDVDSDLPENSCINQDVEKVSKKSKKSKSSKQNDDIMHDNIHEDVAENNSSKRKYDDNTEDAIESITEVPRKKNKKSKKEL